MSPATAEYPLQRARTGCIGPGTSNRALGALPHCPPLAQVLRCVKDCWMRLAVLKERRVPEARVAATPDTVKRLIGLGLSVAIETGAGASASIPDAEFAAAGAEITPDPVVTLEGAGIVFAVQMPLPAERPLIPRGALLICTAGAFNDLELVTSLADAGID